MTAEFLIDNPSRILEKRPFYRGCNSADIRPESSSAFVGAPHNAVLPYRKSTYVTQDKFLQELDPQSHVVHFDDTIPDIAIKNPYNKTIGWIRQKGTRIAFNYQEIIRNKRLQYLCGKPMKFTLCSHSSDTDIDDLFTSIKEDWVNKNMDIWKYKLAKSQLTTGDGAILHYFKLKGEKKTLRHRLLSFEDGYVLLPHYDDDGDMILFGVYYKSDEEERLDVYDETYVYNYAQSGVDDKGWVLEGEPSRHGFEEIPITYKRADVAWNNVQNNIEIYEILYNIYTVIQKKFGSSVLWVKGNYDQKTKKQGWSVILNSSSLDPNADAKVLTPAEPVGTQKLLADIRKEIQMGSSVIMLQPEDIKVSGDVTGIAIKMLLSAAYEKALQEAIEYDDVADNMLRLFIYGLGIENADPTKYSKISIRAEFEAWMPQSDTEIINNINLSIAAGSISKQTARELNPYGKPDEVERGLAQEAKEKADAAEVAQAKTASTEATPSSSSNKN